MKSYPCKRFFGSLSSFFSRNIGVGQRKFHIFKRRLSSQKLKVLENKSDLLQPEVCQLIGSKALDFPSVDQELPACRCVQTADQIHQCRLAGARRPYYSCIIALTHCKVNICKCRDFDIAL